MKKKTTIKATGNKRSQKNTSKRLPRRMMKHSGAHEPDFDVVDDLLSLVDTSGVEPRVAAEHLGVSGDRFDQWIDIGRGDRDAGVRSMFGHLVNALDAVTAGVQIRVIRKILRSPDWRASAWFAERRFSALWGPQNASRAVKGPLVSAGDWKQPDETPEDFVQRAMAFAECVLRGNPLTFVPCDPHSDIDSVNDDDQKTGVRLFVAAILRDMITDGEQVPAYVVEQVKEFFGGTLDIPHEDSIVKMPSSSLTFAQYDSGATI